MFEVDDFDIRLNIGDAPDNGDGGLLCQMDGRVAPLGIEVDDDTPHPVRVRKAGGGEADFNTVFALPYVNNLTFCATPISTP